MNREEFCDLMAKAKEMSGKTTSELIYDLRVMPTNLRRLEKGENNFGVEKLLQYVDAIKHHVFLKKDKEHVCIKQYKDIVQWLKNTREKKSLTLRALADGAKCSNGNIANIENKKVIMSIDTLLKLAEFFEYEITLEPKK